MPIVEVGGELIEFPDDMSDDQIAAAIKSSAGANNPAQGGSIADPLGQGLTFGFADEIAGGVGAGINSVANLFGGGTGESFGDAYRGIRDAARYNNEAFAERNPGTAIAAEIGGGMLTGGVGAARAGVFNVAKNAPTLAGRLAPIVGTGAVQGGLYGAGASEGEDIGDVASDTLQGAAIGGAAAPIIPALAGGARSMAGRVFDTQTANRQFQKFKQVLEDNVPGMRLTTGQTTGSESIRSIETTVGGTLTGGSVSRQLDRNREALQGKLMRMAGFTRGDSSEGLVTIDAVNNASAAFSKKYASILGNRKVDLTNDADFVDAIAEIQGRNLRLIPFQQKKQITEIVDQVFDAATDRPLDAAYYNRVRSDLAALERSNANKPNIAALYRDLKHAIDDAIAGATGKGGRKAAVDTQYNRFTKIRDTFEGTGGTESARGYMPLATLLRRSAKRGKGADSEFTNIVRAGQAVLGDPQPNSGTTTRAINALLLGGSAFDPTGASTASILGLPFGAAQMLSRGYTGSGVVDRLIQAGLLTAPVAAPVGTKVLNPVQ